MKMPQILIPIIIIIIIFLINLLSICYHLTDIRAWKFTCLLNTIFSNQTIILVDDMVMCILD